MPLAAILAAATRLDAGGGDGRGCSAVAAANLAAPAPARPPGPHAPAPGVALQTSGSNEAAPAHVQWEWVGTRRFVHRLFNTAARTLSADLQLLDGVVYVRDVVPYLSVNHGDVGYLFETLCTDVSSTPPPTPPPTTLPHPPAAAAAAAERTKAMCAGPSEHYTLTEVQLGSHCMLLANEVDCQNDRGEGVELKIGKQVGPPMYRHAQCVLGAVKQIAIGRIKKESGCSTGGGGGGGTAIGSSGINNSVGGGQGGGGGEGSNVAGAGADGGADTVDLAHLGSNVTQDARTSDAATFTPQANTSSGSGRTPRILTEVTVESVDEHFAELSAAEWGRRVSFVSDVLTKVKAAMFEGKVYRLEGKCSCEKMRSFGTLARGHWWM